MPPKHQLTCRQQGRSLPLVYFLRLQSRTQSHSCLRVIQPAAPPRSTATIQILLWPSRSQAGGFSPAVGIPGLFQSSSKFSMSSLILLKDRIAKRTNISQRNLEPRVAFSLQYWPRTSINSLPSSGSGKGYTAFHLAVSTLYRDLLSDNQVKCHSK